MRLTRKQRNARNGLLYILPFLIGLCAFFIPAFVSTIQYAFSKIDSVTFETTFVGIANFRKAFLEDANFPQILTSTLVDSVKNIPLILIFSYFVAVLLKKPFKGSNVVKGFFFLTVILSSDIFLTLNAEIGYLETANMNSTLENSSDLIQSLDGDTFTQYLLSYGVGTGVIDFLAQAVKSVSNIFNKSGVQIFIFLAGLSSIPDSMYEAASVEGASGWESFWKITFPMTASTIVVNFVYTVTEEFNSMMSGTMQYIYSNGLKGGNYGYGSALSVIYFVIEGLLIATVFLVIRKSMARNE